MNDLYSQWVDALEQVGIHPLSDETCCKLLAIVYVYGGSMELIYNKKLLRDIQYAQRRANICGGETPDVEMAMRTKEIIKKLENELKDAPHKKDSESPFSIIHPEWVKSFMSSRYGINKMWL